MRQLNNNKEVLHKLRDSRLLSANTRGIISFQTRINT